MTEEEDVERALPGVGMRVLRALYKAGEEGADTPRLMDRLDLPRTHVSVALWRLQRGGYVEVLGWMRQSRARKTKRFGLTPAGRRRVREQRTVTL